MKFFVLGTLFANVLVAQSQTFPETSVVGSGYTLKARAYIHAPRSSNSKGDPGVHYDLHILTTPGSPSQWDFTLPGYPLPLTEMNSLPGSPDDKNHTKTTIRVTLHKFEIYEEKVTFKDLDLLPITPPSKVQPQLPEGPRFLSLPETRSLTTPSGIKITLPPQSGPRVEDLNSVYNGNIGALWVRLQVEPDTRLSSLPDSPLFRKYSRPVSIKLEVPEPNFLVSYTADNTFKSIKVGIPKLETLSHLDELTLIVRQRVDLETVPVAVEVPISKPLPRKATHR